MVVRLTTTSKRENSTEIPLFSSATSLRTNCRLKAHSSVMEPVLIFDRENLGHEYNYVLIPDFKRYYWVTDVVYVGSLIVYRCRIDVLASYKTAIGNSTQYVLRSASRSDGAIPDTMYPLTCDIKVESDTKGSVFVQDGDISKGMFSVGISGNGGIDYFLMEEWYFIKFIGRLLTDGYAEETLGTLQAAMYPQAKLAVDPLQYIVSVRWLPFRYFLGEAVTSILVGYVSINLGEPPSGSGFEPVRKIGFPIWHPDDYKFTFKQHPQSARGKYTNASPYTSIEFSFPPFPEVDIDGAVLCNFSGLAVRLQVDMRTGDARVSLYGYVGDEYRYLFNRLFANVGVEIPLSQVVKSGEISPLTIANAVRGIAMGDVLAPAAAIGDMAQMNLPKVRQTGTQQSYLSLLGSLDLWYLWHYAANDDPTIHGRPLCSRILISTLSGYILCAAGTEIQITGTADEEAQIRSYMEGGFFYE